MLNFTKSSFKRLLIILGLIIFSQVSVYGHLSFVKEKLTITVHPAYCELDGDYIFLNPNRVSAKILYPFVINEKLGFPDSILIRDQSGEIISHKNKSSGVTFHFRKSTFFNAYYRQKTANHYFEYILTTTQAWRSPLKEMIIKIKISKELDLTDLSLSYNAMEDNGDFTTYIITRNNYMPKKNIIIRWSEK